MKTSRTILATLAMSTLVGCGRKDTQIEDLVARHMVGEALLAAHFVAAAERSGMGADAINAVLRDVVEKSAIDEFWITDATGHAYLRNSDVDFTFSGDATAEPQASVFWALLQGREEVVIQEARVREIDDRVFKYVGVGGIDHPRIVQIGVSAQNLTGRP